MKLSCRDWLDYVNFVKKSRQDNNMTDRISLVYAELKLNCRDLFDWVWFVMKTRVDNKVTNHTGVVYDENDNELLW